MDKLLKLYFKGFLLLIPVMMNPVESMASQQCDHPRLKLDHIQEIIKLQKAKSAIFKKCFWEVKSPTHLSNMYTTPEYSNYKLPLNWDDEITGQDLAKEFMLKNYPISLAPVGMIDSHFYKDPLMIHPGAFAKNSDASAYYRDPTTYNSLMPMELLHGNLVLSKLVSPTLGGIYKGRVSYVRTFQDINSESDTKKIWKEIEDSDIRVLNLSYKTKLQSVTTWRNRAVKKRKKDLILVIASGNYADEGVNIIPKIEALSLAIKVGASTAIGSISDYSQEGPELDIVAPVDDFLPVKTPDKRRLLAVPGTSVAAPQVSAALTNSITILPEIQLDIAKILLRKTATKLFHQRAQDLYQPNKSINYNGAGNLNSYKLIRVTDRLKNRFENKLQELEKMNYFTGKSEKLIRSLKIYQLKKLLDEPSLLDFKEESEKLTKQAINLLGIFSCKAQKTAINLLRKAILLDNKSTAAEHLISYYQRNNFEPLAKYYESTTLPPKKYLSKLSKTERENYLSRFTEQGRDKVKYEGGERVIYK